MSGTPSDRTVRHDVVSSGAWNYANTRSDPAAVAIVVWHEKWRMHNNERARHLQASEDVWAAYPTGSAASIQRDVQPLQVPESLTSS
ncbi:hypothetical protein EXIGLDRAFT_727123 [Exidia glandulosa HHB12029]|uniref:Uncharacterized protein n=1 Tax=Exidia glandulosa HHB12029 TaxID=1314781 RepID=A0A165M5V7_EXIGL|nr:hypothetical protein EXIGLDRAFT_727122 [Exidia glandulosa HHB12029]KZV98810.1 hypothetical protein EXIGLDRAFT_727123 [Exidia glandulosa HHB12029]